MPVTLEDIARALATEGGPGTHLATAVTFRRWQKDKVLRTGVHEVRFFVPPIATPLRRGWADGLCTALGRDCMPMDPDFLRSITPPMWDDESHLRAEGARRYTHWFAEKVRAVQ